MNDLNALLERAAGPATAPVDPHADVTRGHRALTRTRRRRAAGGLLGVAAAGVVGVTGIRLAQPDTTSPQHAVGTTRTHGIGLIAQPFEAGPFTFDQTPEGWEVQGAYPEGVTIAPVGFPDQEPLSFAGKLVIMFDANPPTGEKVQLDGRTLWIRDGEGYTTIATRTLADEPTGVVSIQYPSDTGWTRDTMLAFLAGVHVGADAQPGVG